MALLRIMLLGAVVCVGLLVRPAHSQSANATNATNVTSTATCTPAELDGVLSASHLCAGLQDGGSLLAQCLPSLLNSGLGGTANLTAECRQCVLAGSPSECFDPSLFQCSRPAELATFIALTAPVCGKSLAGGLPSDRCSENLTDSHTAWERGMPCPDEVQACLQDDSCWRTLTSVENFDDVGSHDDSGSGSGQINHAADCQQHENCSALAVCLAAADQVPATTWDGMLSPGCGDCVTSADDWAHALGSCFDGLQDPTCTSAEVPVLAAPEFFLGEGWGDCGSEAAASCIAAFGSAPTRWNTTCSPYALCGLGDQCAACLGGATGQDVHLGQCFNGSVNCAEADLPVLLDTMGYCTDGAVDCFVDNLLMLSPVSTGCQACVQADESNWFSSCLGGHDGDGLGRCSGSELFELAASDSGQAPTGQLAGCQMCLLASSSLAGGADFVDGCFDSADYHCRASEAADLKVTMEHCFGTANELACSIRNLNSSSFSDGCAACILDPALHPLADRSFLPNSDICFDSGLISCEGSNLGAVLLARLMCSARPEWGQMTEREKHGCIMGSLSQTLTDRCFVCVELFSEGAGVLEGYMTCVDGLNAGTCTASELDPFRRVENCNESDEFCIMLATQVLTEGCFGCFVKYENDDPLGSCFDMDAAEGFSVESSLTFDNADVAFIPIGSATRDAFEFEFRTEIVNQFTFEGVPLSVDRVTILGITAGSVIVRFNIATDTATGGEALEAGFASIRGSDTSISVRGFTANLSSIADPVVLPVFAAIDAASSTSQTSCSLVRPHSLLFTFSPLLLRALDLNSSSQH